MTLIRVTETDMGRTALSFPYDDGLVSLIKDTVHHTLRTWDNVDKVWTFSLTEDAEQVILYARQLGHKIDDQRPLPLVTKLHAPFAVAEPKMPPPPIKFPDPDPEPFMWAVHMFDALGPKRSLAAYKAIRATLVPGSPTADADRLEQLDGAWYGTGNPDRYDYTLGDQP